MCWVTQKQRQCLTLSVLTQCLPLSPSIVPSLEEAMSNKPFRLLLMAPRRSLRKDLKNCAQRSAPPEAGACRRYMEEAGKSRPRVLGQTDLLLHHFRVGPFQLSSPAPKQHGPKQVLGQSQVPQRHY